MEKTNEILTIAGELVEKRYSAKAGDCCHKCRFWSDAYGMCRAERADSTPPCKDYDSKEGGFAYFVPAKESELGNGPWEKNYQPSGINQPVPAEEGVDTRVVEALSGEVSENIIGQIKANIDAQKAAEEACAKCHISGRCFVEDKGRKDACDYLRGVKAGMLAERERLMKEAVEVKVYYDFENRLAVTAQLPEDSPHKFCDKVKLIILK